MFFVNLTSGKDARYNYPTLHSKRRYFVQCKCKLVLLLLLSNLQDCWQSVYFRHKFRVHSALFDHTVRGALSPLHTSRVLGSATKGQSRDRDSRAALRNPLDKRHIRRIYSGRSARVATRPESQAAPPHKSSETIVTSQPWYG